MIDMFNNTISLTVGQFVLVIIGCITVGGLVFWSMVMVLIAAMFDSHMRVK
jgi:hypothetical protein